MEDSISNCLGKQSEQNTGSYDMRMKLSACIHESVRVERYFRYVAFDLSRY